MRVCRPSQMATDSPDPDSDTHGSEARCFTRTIPRVQCGPLVQCHISCGKLCLQPVRHHQLRHFYHYSAESLEVINEMPAINETTPPTTTGALHTISHLPSNRWPGESRQAVVNRAVGYIVIWIAAEILIGAMLPIIGLALNLIDRGFKLNFPELLEPRELVLICVALAATRLPDLIKPEPKDKLRGTKISVTMFLFLIIVIGGLWSADIGAATVTHAARTSEARGFFPGYLR